MKDNDVDTPGEYYDPDPHETEPPFRDPYDDDLDDNENGGFGIHIDGDPDTDEIEE